MISQELIAKQRREGMRWNIINTLNKARPHTTSETFLLDIMNAIYPQTTALELRQQLDYLADRKMVDLNKAPHGLWFADLTSLGVDIANIRWSAVPVLHGLRKYGARHGATQQH